MAVLGELGRSNSPESRMRPALPRLTASRGDRNGWHRTLRSGPGTRYPIRIRSIGANRRPVAQLLACLDEVSLARTTGSRKLHAAIRPLGQIQYDRWNANGFYRHVHGCRCRSPQTRR